MAKFKYGVLNHTDAGIELKVSNEQIPECSGYLTYQIPLKDVEYTYEKEGYVRLMATRIDYYDTKSDYATKYFSVKDSDFIECDVDLKTTYRFRNLFLPKKYMVANKRYIRYKKEIPLSITTSNFKIKNGWH